VKKEIGGGHEVGGKSMGRREKKMPERGGEKRLRRERLHRGTQIDREVSGQMTPLGVKHAGRG